MGTITPAGDGLSVNYTSSGFSFSSSGGKSRLGFSSSLSSAVWDNIIISQGSTYIEENFNNGSWDSSNFEVTVGSSNSSASSGSYTSGGGTRGVLRTTSDFVATLANPVSVEATLYTPDQLNISFFTFRGEGVANNGNGEPDDAINLRIHNFWNVGIDYRPDADSYGPGDAWFTDSPIRMILTDYGNGNGYSVEFIKQPLPQVVSATYDQANGILVVTGTNFIGLSGTNNDIDVTRVSFAGVAAGSYSLTDTPSVDILSASQFSLTLSSTDRAGVLQLLDADGAFATDGTAYNVSFADDWLPGSVTSANISDISSNILTVSGTPSPALPASSSTQSSGSPATPAGNRSSENSEDKNSIPSDSAPGAVSFQSDDYDGDGLREVLIARDGVIVDGNRDGLQDAQQSNVAGLRLINDGSRGSDYGAFEVEAGIQIRGISLISLSQESVFPVLPRGGGGAVAISLPDAIENAFAGVVSFEISGVEAGGSTQVKIHLPAGLSGDSDMAYVRFNYVSNRFEEYVDASGAPLYSFIDIDGDGFSDAVNLILVDGDPYWDGDGSANGTVVDPGFLAVGMYKLNGTKRKDVLTGNILANTIKGRDNDDWLQGELGADVLIGGKGKDRYVYVSADESPASARDTVTFEKQDRFVFSSFDGDSTTEGQQKLSFIGKNAFSNVAGELRATRSLLEADIDGDGVADFAVDLRSNLLITERNLVF